VSAVVSTCTQLCDGWLSCVKYLNKEMQQNAPPTWSCVIDSNKEMHQDVFHPPPHEGPFVLCDVISVATEFMVRVLQPTKGLQCCVASSVRWQCSWLESCNPPRACSVVWRHQ
jgi:hypothetical protein